MGVKTIGRRCLLAASVTMVIAGTTLFAVVGGVAPASAATSSACPNAKALTNFQTGSNVSAGFSNAGNVTTYTFSSLQNENPVDGVPGLIKYCVYPTPAGAPTEVTPQAIGANGEPWVSRTGPHDFSFVRPDGNPSNIPLDGTSTTMGTAAWSTVPTDQIILLHINDSTVCQGLYGPDSSDTCFVKPSPPPPPGPDCTHGDTAVAYNAMPFDVVNCINPAVGFEATNTNEFGDEVTLAGTNRGLVSLQVLFASYACESGHWNTGDCVSTTGDTFDWPITANLYAVADCSGTPCPGALLDSVTQTKTIPYRPSADPTNCTSNPAQWFNPLAPGGGACQNNIAKVLTFSFPSGTTLPDTVIWTVAFNTSTSGYVPIGPASCSTGPGGCPYDSLNVGAKTYPGAPYAGTDVNVDQAFISSGGPTAPLEVQSGWSSNRPLGEIVTGM